MLRIKGEPLSFDRYKPISYIYNDPSKDIVLKAGRQISKSTTICNRMILKSIIYPHYQQLYVVPLQIQATRFSHFYLDKSLKSMPLASEFLGKGTIQNVMCKSLTNGSIINITYIGDNNPERGRGIPSDENAYDEVQDLIWDDIIIIDQCLSGSDYAFRIYSGTPKTMENVLEYLFSESDQKEWVIKCSHCDKYNIPVDPEVSKMIQKKGLSCSHCCKIINPIDGEWISFNKNSQRSGYHLPQIIIPRNVLQQDRWDSIYNNWLTYPKSKFYNEVLGLSIDKGGRLITKEDIECCCGNIPKNINDYVGIVAGIDWAVQGNDESFTVLTILGQCKSHFEVLYIKKYLGGDLLDQVKDILKICKSHCVSLYGCDWGIGHTNNLLLMQEAPGQVYEYQYARQKNMIKWNDAAQRFIISRTTSLNILFIDIKKGLFKFPKLEEFKPYVQDLLSNYEDIPENMSDKRFIRTKGIPDDFTHALNFASLTLKRFLDMPMLST